MRALGETDAFPSDDLGLRRALAKKKSLVSVKNLAKITDK
jgi:3-methyladenine DNA glycosylase/8-oxoguanine DNA glycosylase